MQQKTSYSVCLLRYEVRQTIFCYFRPLFALLPHYWLPKLKFGKNVKKTPGDTIILHMCTINQDHMMHGSWDIKCKEQSFLSFLTLQTTQNFEKKKRLILHLYTANCDHMMYSSWDIKHNTQRTTNRIFCHFGLFFCNFEKFSRIHFFIEHLQWLFLKN